LYGHNTEDVMTIIEYIDELCKGLNSETYKANKIELDKLADNIISEEKDLFFKENPEYVN
jgi:hypothetical protein